MKVKPQTLKAAIKEKRKELKVAKQMVKGFMNEKNGLRIIAQIEHELQNLICESMAPKRP